MEVVIREKAAAQELRSQATKELTCLPSTDHPPTTQAPARTRHSAVMSDHPQYQPVRASEKLLSQSQGPTYEHSSNNNSGKFRNTIVTTDDPSLYDSRGLRMTDSFAASGLNNNFNSQRATEMKLTALEPEPGLPAERPRDYKGKYRVRAGC